jgi:hypothetical protein
MSKITGFSSVSLLAKLDQQLVRNKEYRNILDEFDYSEHKALVHSRSTSIGLIALTISLPFFAGSCWTVAIIVNLLCWALIIRNFVSLLWSLLRANSKLKRFHKETPSWNMKVWGDRETPMVAAYWDEDREEFLVELHRENEYFSIGYVKPDHAIMTATFGGDESRRALRECIHTYNDVYDQDSEDFYDD